MLMMRQAPVSSAWMASRALVIDSSRQTGVAMLALQRGMVGDVVVVERLLDHHQVERVEA